MVKVLIIGIIIVFLLVIVDRKTESKTDSKDPLKKILLGIPMTIALFVVYYIIIGIIGLPVLMGMFGGDSGAWAIALIAGFTIGPILALVTTWKLLSKNK